MSTDSKANQLSKNSWFAIGSLLVVSEISAVIFLVILYTAFHPQREPQLPFSNLAGVSTAQATSTLKKTAVPKITTKLLIPSLNVNAWVENVGVTTKGYMASPSSYKNVGWYAYGVRPGEIGVAILAGHKDNGLGFAGVFEHLDKIQVGTEISVKTGEKTLNFEVTEIYTTDYKTSLDTITLSHNNTAMLALITCEGDWVKESKTYDKRIIVLAKLK